MSTIRAQLKQLRKQIKIPYVVRFVDEYIPKAQQAEQVIYIHIWIKERANELVDKS